MPDYLILECNELACAESVEVEVVAGQPNVTKLFEEQAPGWISSHACP